MYLIQNSFKRLHYPIDIIARCVRWYQAYSLSLRNLEEMMNEQDHRNIKRRIRIVPG
jgi:transposase-like protein